MSDKKDMCQQELNNKTINATPNKLTKNEVKQMLRNPNLSNEEKNNLMELLWEGIEVKK